jgi:hypothetical protein
VLEDPTTATPVEIDTRLNELAWQHVGLITDRQLAEKRLQRTLMQPERQRLWELNQRIRVNRDERRALEAEYDRRPWARAYVVPGGHVHADYHCHTLYPETQRYLAAPVSGFDESQVVAAAGERACTVCYPAAPVNAFKRKTTIFTPDEEQAAHERAERADKRAAKAVAQAEKGIGNPDGTTLRTHSYGEIRTERTAQIEYVDAAAYVAACDDGYPYTGRYDDCKAEAALILAALAHKRGTTIAQQRQDLAAKVDKKRRGYFSQQGGE